jgi:putative redox protein
MKIDIKQQGSDFNLIATNEDGNTISMDASPEIGGQGKGMRPMQLLLSSIGGCSSIDIIQILKKQRVVIDSFEVEVVGLREPVEQYSIFKNIVLHFKVKSNADRQKIEAAIQLSLDKYCSVSKILEPTAHIEYQLTIQPIT